MVANNYSFYMILNMMITGCSSTLLIRGVKANGRLAVIQASKQAYSISE